MTLFFIILMVFFFFLEAVLLGLVKVNLWMWDSTSG